MILDRVYGREHNEEDDESYSEEDLEEEKDVDSRQTLVRSPSKTEQKRQQRANAGTRTEFHPSNMVLGVARINTENWVSTAQIETPDFRLIRESAGEMVKGEEEEETEDEAYVTVHRDHEEKELAARKSNKPNTRRIIRGKGAFKTPKRRGRPPRNKRKRKSHFAQTRSTLPQLSSYSLSEENQAQIDQQLFYDHYAPLYEEGIFPEEGEYDSAEEGDIHEPEGLEEEMQQEELVHHEQLARQSGLLGNRLEDLQHSLEPRRRASSLSSNGLGSPIFPPSNLLEAWP